MLALLKWFSNKGKLSQEEEAAIIANTIKYDILIL
jgi:hypothetical protein